MIAEVAQEFFGFTPSDHNRVVVGDGLEYVRGPAAATVPSTGSTAPSAAAPSSATGEGGAPAAAVDGSGPASAEAGVATAAGGAAGAGAAGAGAAGDLHAIIVDVDSKDLSSGMSFPPKVG